MNHRIEYSAEEMNRALERSLEDLNIFRFNSQYRDALGTGFLDALNKWEEDIRRCRETPFTIAVAGDFKRGKSTLINALLGQEVVTTDVTTETVTTNQISFGLSSNEAVLSGGRRMRLSDTEMRRDRLEAIMEEIGEPICRLEIRRPLDILKKITILDTPGTGDVLRDFSEDVKDSLLRADAVIYVFNVQYPLSRTEQLFLKGTILPQKHTRLFMVGNFSDTLENMASYERVYSMAEQRISGFLPGTKPYMVSALDALSLRLGEERKQGEVAGILEMNFQNLLDDISGLASVHADTVVPDRMQRLIRAMTSEMSDFLTAMEKGLSVEMTDADQLIQDAENRKNENMVNISGMVRELDEIICGMKAETNAWLGQFMDKIVEDSKSLSSMSNDDLKRYYEFYCVDMLQEAMNTCLEYHQDKLIDILAEVAEELGKNAVENLDVHSNVSFRLSLDNRVWTKGDTVGLVTSCISSLNMLTFVASLATDSISGAMRETEKQIRIPELINQISQKLTAFSAMVTRTVDSIYSELGEKARLILVEYFEDRWEREAELLEQTVQTARKSSQEKETIRVIIQEAGKIIDSLKRWS